MSGASPSTGDLSAVSFLSLYLEAARQEQNALLSLQLPDRKLEIHFRKGSPERIRSDAAADQLGAFLMTKGLLSEGQLAQAEASKDKFGGELVSALFGLGLLNPATAFPQLAVHAQGLLLQALRAEAGSYRGEPKELPAAQALPLGNRWAVLLEVLRRVPSAEIQKRLAAQLQLPALKSTPLVPPQELRLSPQELRALGSVDGVRSLAQLAQASPADADHLFRVAWILKEVQGLSFSSTPVRSAAEPRPPPAPVSRPAPTPAAALAQTAKAGALPRPPAAPLKAGGESRPPAAPAPAQTLEELRAKVAGSKSLNHFQLLGVPEETHSAAVKAAYFKLAKQFHPDTAPPDAPEEMVKLRAALFSALGEAARRLGDDAQRQAYLEELRGGNSGAQEVELEQILKGEELFLKGSIMVKARKYPEAVEMLTQAIQANAEEGEFYAWRGIARFMASTDKRSAFPSAKADVEEALKRSPRCAPAYFFQGQMAKVLGDNAAALKYFQKAVELDPKHIDAQREVRLLERK